MKKVSKKLSVLALCVVMLVLSVMPAFAAETTYIENHSVIDCANYYLYNRYYYTYLIKIPNGASLNSVKLYDIYGDRYMNLGEIPLGNHHIKFEYSNQDGDFYTYQLYLTDGVPRYYWEHYGIKLYYDNGNEHYMATNTSNGSETEGPGYILTR